MVRMSVKNLTKRFGATTAVDDVTFDVEQGKFLTLLGPSGCGKSTTLRMIAGVATPDSGKVFFDDADVTDLSARDRNVAMVFQSYALYPTMSARDNIGFNLKIKGVPKEERTKRVEKAAELVEISHLLHRIPSQLSGGQRQRVALARALVREPNVFLLDEPLSNLDAKLRASTRVEIRKLQQKLKVTTIYVTHDQLEAITMSDRIALLKDGRLQQVGSPLELYNKPSNQFVAEFIGSPAMNFFDCAVVKIGDELALDLGFATINLNANVQKILKERGLVALRLGIRPEEISLAKQTGKSTLIGEVFAIEQIGPRQHVYLSFKESKIVVEAARDFQCDVGERLEIILSADMMRLFDDKGNNLTL